MPIVIDASVIATWHFKDERNPKGDAVLDMLNTERACVPHIWWFEVRNMLLTGERRSRTQKQDADDFLAFLDTLPIDLQPSDGLLTMAVARRHLLSFYDAAYLALAIEFNCMLATFDRQLLHAAPQEGVRLFRA